MGRSEWDIANYLRACSVPILIVLAWLELNDPSWLRELKPDAHIAMTVRDEHRSRSPNG